MNPDIQRLQDYPFQRLAALKQGLEPCELSPISLSIGEPQHSPPDFVVDMMGERELIRVGLGKYPATRGLGMLREAIADWLSVRFKLDRSVLDPERHVLPVCGTREALFSFGQAVLSGSREACVLMPNPGYQIYEGAALLRGASPVYVDCPAELGFNPDFSAISESTWRKCELVYICSPGNPTGAILGKPALAELIELADRHDFIIAADECYSEIYREESAPPPGLLEVCQEMGRSDYRRCVVFHSLSKRSNLPGLRSGFVAGDAEVLDQYYRYRTYHGCAMPEHVQRVSAAAWGDESHVIENRALYRSKFNAVTPILESLLELTVPEGGFYYWARTAEPDPAFASALFQQQNVTVLPGSFLAREYLGQNPGSHRIRMALVASPDECLDAAVRIRDFMTGDFASSG